MLKAAWKYACSILTYKEVPFTLVSPTGALQQLLSFFLKEDVSIPRRIHHALVTRAATKHYSFPSNLKIWSLGEVS